VDPIARLSDQGESDEQFEVVIVCRGDSQRQAALSWRLSTTNNRGLTIRIILSCTSVFFVFLLSEKFHTNESKTKLKEIKPKRNSNFFKCENSSKEDSRKRLQKLQKIKQSI